VRLLAPSLAALPCGLLRGPGIGGKNVDWLEKVSDEQYRK
jgi:hypothetical protein